jgi:hypothetical protein
MTERLLHCKPLMMALRLLGLVLAGGWIVAWTICHAIWPIAVVLYLGWLYFNVG